MACQKMYEENQIMPIFKTYEGIGHWAKADINLDVVMNISSVKCSCFSSEDF